MTHLCFAAELVEIEQRMRREIERHNGDAFPACCQLLLMAGSIASLVPEAERDALARRLTAFALDLVANDRGQAH
jgi:hypothetical protein